MRGDKGMINEALPERRRVRTPGKHIVLFGLALTFLLVLAAAVLRSAPVHLPEFQNPQFSADGKARFVGEPQEFITDLSVGDDGRAAMIKLTARIEAKDADDLRIIERDSPAIRERISFFLRELEPSDLEGSAAMARMKAELKKRVNLAIAPAEAADVVIEDVVVQ